MKKKLVITLLFFVSDGVVYGMLSKTTFEYEKKKRAEKNFESKLGEKETAEEGVEQTRKKEEATIKKLEKALQTEKKQRFEKERLEKERLEKERFESAKINNQITGLLQEYNKKNVEDKITIYDHISEQLNQTIKSINLNNLSIQLRIFYANILDKALQQQTLQKRLKSIIVFFKQEKLTPENIAKISSGEEILKQWYFFWSNIEKGFVQPPGLFSKKIKLKSDELQKIAESFNKNYFDLTGNELPVIEDILSKIMQNTFDAFQEVSSLFSISYRSSYLINRFFQLGYDPNIPQAQGTWKEKAKKIEELWNEIWKTVQNIIKKEDIVQLGNVLTGYTYTFKNKKLQNIVDTLYETYKNMPYAEVPGVLKNPSELLNKLYNAKIMSNALTEEDRLSSTKRPVVQMQPKTQKKV